MAERTVTVRLRALVDDYKKAMGDAGRATQDIAGKADRFKQLGQSTANLGDSLTRNVTLPLVAVGAAAVKMSLDFDKAFQEMHQLAGVSASEIDGLKDSVLGLAGETGKAPQELAEALYFIRSSGLEGAAALDALEMSAKASAAGMGTTVEIADAVTSAMNAYAESNLTAAEATDVLVATAREGKAEPAELASQMGRLLPLSSELGITFNDVGAAIATLSLKGNDAAASSTLLQNVMQKLLRPSQQASEALARVGISTEDIRTMIAEKGLLGTLETLKASLGDSGFTNFWEDAQAVQGALALTGGDIEATRERFEALNNSAGDTDEAFGRWAETMGAENAQAFANLQVAAIRLGDVLAPIAADVISFAASFLSAFSKLPEPVQKTVIALAAFAAAIGPLMSVGGRLASVAASTYKMLVNLAVPAGSVSGAFNNAATSTSRFSGTLGTLGAAAGIATAVVGIGLAIDAAEKAAERARREKAVEDLSRQFLATGDASDELSAALDGNFDSFVQTQGVFNQLLDTNLAAAERFIEAAEAAGFEEEAIDALRAQLEEKAAADQQAASDSETNTRATEGATGAYDAEAAAVTAAVEALSAYSDALAAQFDPMFGMMDALQGNVEANQALTDAQTALNEARASGDPAAIAEAEAALAQAHRDVTGSALDVSQATATMNSAIAENPALLEESKSQLRTWVDQGLITQATADEMARKFDETAFSAVVLGGTDPNVDVSSTGTTATGQNLEGVTKRAVAIPKSRNTTTTTTGTGGARSSLDGVSRAASSIPKNRHTTTQTTGTVPARSALNDVAGAANGIPRNVTITVATKHVGSPVPKRARGGPVLAGETYLVGEEGPELLTMGAQSGTVYPNSVFDRGAGKAGLMSAPSATAVDPMALVNGFAAALTASRNRQLASDTLHTVWLADRFEDTIEDLSAAQKERHVDLRQNLWVIFKNRVTPNTFSATRSAQGLPQFADGGIVASVHAGEMILNGAQQARLWDLLSGPMVAGPAGGGSGSQVVYNVDLRGALVPNGTEVEKAVFAAIRNGGEHGRALTVRGRRL